MSDRPAQPIYWACVVAPDQKVRCDDLPVSVFADIAEKTGIHWFQLLNAPLRHEKAGMELYRACCRHVGVEPRELALREFADIFVMVDDDLPTQFEDGIPTDPKEPATTT